MSRISLARRCAIAALAFAVAPGAVHADEEPEGGAAQRVRRFLAFLEQERHNQVRTRNQRLAAVRAFFEYLATRAPEMLAQAQQVNAIPVKRTTPSQTLYLDLDEVQVLFENLPAEGPFALRDRALLLFLYNTGARAQEVVDLKVGGGQSACRPVGTQYPAEGASPW